MNEIRVSSWHEINEVLYESSWQEGLRRFRSPYAFRGVTSSNYELTTSLKRLGEASDELERHILRSFRRYARREEVLEDSIWNWLALAQHHGLPTRLLDWSYSPYVALHFVTERPEDYDTDGVVWCVDYFKTNQLLPAKLKDILAEEGFNVNVFTAEMLGQAARTLAEFDRLASEEFVIFFEPPSLDERIVNQFSLFSLMSDPGTSLHDWLRRHPDVCKRVIIPADLKWEVRDKLDQANITERVLYPGLDGLSRWLKRYYTPRQH